jgi:hypothetical protein
MQAGLQSQQNHTCYLGAIPTSQKAEKRRRPQERRDSWGRINLADARLPSAKAGATRPACGVPESN